MNKFAPALPALLACLLGLGAGANPAEAKRVFAGGSGGGIGAFNHQGQYGKTVGAGAFRRGQGGAGFVGGSYTGPNGGTFQGGTGGAFKKGVGGFRHSQFQGTGANGGSANGYMNSKYNAQTGQGSRESGVSATSAGGQNYGYDAQSTYTRGQGGQTTIDTQNKGDYTVDWQKGEKPVVTPVSQTNPSP